jgi:hypothetical protein
MSPEFDRLYAASYLGHLVIENRNGLIVEAMAAPR